MWWARVVVLVSSMGTNLMFVLFCVAAVYAAFNREEIKQGHIPVFSSGN
jgi:hypothetical protein